MSNKKRSKRINLKSISHPKLLLLGSVIAILIFPFVLLYLGRLGKSFLELLITASPNYSDLLAYYGVALTILFSFQIYRWQKKDDQSDRDQALLQQSAPDIAIELVPHCENQFTLVLHNCSNHPCFIECVCNTPALIKLAFDGTVQKKIAFSGSENTDKETLHLSKSEVDYCSGTPQCFSVDVSAKNGTFWHCEYLLSKLCCSDRLFYYLTTAIMTDRAELNKEC